MRDGHKAGDNARGGAAVGEASRAASAASAPGKQTLVERIATADSAVQLRAEPVEGQGAAGCGAGGVHAAAAHGAGVTFVFP